MSSNLTLSNIDIDFETVQGKINTFLQTKDSWKNSLTSSTGSTMVDIGAYIGSSDKFAIEAALREAFPDTARSSKSILAIAKGFWGVHIIRKKPAKISVSLINNSSTTITIPKYSQFNIATLDFFSRNPITLLSSVSTSAILYQGMVKSESRTFGGITNEKVYLGSASTPFSISDEDLYCIVSGVEEYSKTTDSIFETGPTSSPIFFENTLPTGEIEIFFGDGLYGKLPSSTDTLNFIFAETIGSSANNIVIIDEQVIYNNDSNITGITTSSSNGGEDEKDPEYYRLNGPALRSAKVRGGGVNRAEYRAVGLQYPGVIDCTLLGQGETFPGDKNYMNVLVAVILANPAFTNTQFQGFVSFMQEKTIDGLEYIQQNATPISSNILIDIYCTAKADPNTVQSQVLTAFSGLVALKQGMLGFSRFKSDLINLAESAGGGKDYIDYIILNSPSADIIVQKTQYVQFNSITVNAYYSTRSLISN